MPRKERPPVTRIRQSVTWRREMRKETEQLLRALTEADGVPGFEQEVRKLMRAHLEPLGEIEVDRLGSIVGKKTGTADSPRIMLPAHMDEIGFMVKLITDKGFVKFSPLGGWWSQVLLAQRLRIKTRKGDVVGVLGAKPPHLLKNDERNKVAEMKDMYLDIGAKDKKAAEAMGVRPGDPIVPVSTYERLNGTKCLMAKAWDDRAGCAVIIEALRQLQRVKHPKPCTAPAPSRKRWGSRARRRLPPSSSRTWHWCWMSALLPTRRASTTMRPRARLARDRRFASATAA